MTSKGVKLSRPGVLDRSAPRDTRSAATRVALTIL
ncbi:hypothetical protein COLO4_25701 [Corchorus olitorius]|uniref:Uncharacterized protein n=1 Tax=Corchorus olitorius TaxID=93759 RepID=A0A1R3I0E3_9ROSI|nr:hypothetical protein COLO4_25701 [Corchorus olitorius]